MVKQFIKKLKRARENAKINRHKESVLTGFQRTQITDLNHNVNDKFLRYVPKNRNKPRKKKINMEESKQRKKIIDFKKDSQKMI